MLKHTAFAFLLVGLAFAQREYAEHLDDAGLLPGSKIKCIGEVPKDFACAIFFDIDPPFRIDIVRDACFRQLREHIVRLGSESCADAVTDSRSVGQRRERFTRVGADWD